MHTNLERKTWLTTHKSAECVPHIFYLFKKQWPCESALFFLLRWCPFSPSVWLAWTRTAARFKCVHAFWELECPRGGTTGNPQIMKALIWEKAPTRLHRTSPTNFLFFFFREEREKRWKVPRGAQLEHTHYIHARGILNESSVRC